MEQEITKQNFEGLYDINYRIVQGKPVIFLAIRNKDRTKTIKRVENFLPYCYIAKALLNGRQPCDKIIKIEDKNYKDIYGKDVIKCYVRKPSDIYFIKNYYIDVPDMIYEADLLYSLRYAIDEVGEIIPTNYKVLTYDIETTVDSGFPKDSNPVEIINCMSFHNNFTNKKTTFVWRDDIVPRVEQLEDGEIRYYSNEVDMLKGMLDYWYSVDADIISGWNVMFDIKYTIARLRYLGIDDSKLCNINRNEFEPIIHQEDGTNINDTVKVRPKGEPEILNLVLFDALRAYKLLHFGVLESFSLQAVATKELSMEKLPVHNTSKVWREDLKTLIKYNRLDVDLVVKLNEKCKLILLLDSIKRFSGVRNLTDTFFMSRNHDTRILRKYNGKVVFPTKPPFKERSPDDKENHLSGAYVYSKPGLYDNVATLDFSGMYLNIIKLMNLSKECIDMENGKLVNPESGLKINFNKEGIMPSVIDDLFKLKKDLKNEIKNSGSQDLRDKMFAVKIVTNSVWGVINLSNFRLTDLRLGNTVTYWGRTLIQKVRDIIERKFGYEVVGCDTDSCMFVLPKDVMDFVNKGYEVRNSVNTEIQKWLYDQGFEGKYMKVEFEKFAKKAIFQTKKRYAMNITWTEDEGIVDTTKVVGMSSRRSDVNAISKKVQKTVIDMLLKGSLKEDIYKYVVDKVNSIIESKVSIDDIAIPVKLEKDADEYEVNAPKLRGIKAAERLLGLKFKAGMKFRMIYIKNCGEFDTICFEDQDQLLKNIKIDYNKMIEKSITQKIKPIFDTMKWDTEYNELLNYAKNKLNGQKTLF